MKVTKKEALEFKKRWETVNRVELKELRRASAAKKLHQLAVVMNWVKDFGWVDVLKSEELPVRERWIKLKKLYHA